MKYIREMEVLGWPVFLVLWLIFLPLSYGAVHYTTYEGTAGLPLQWGIAIFISGLSAGIITAAGNDWLQRRVEARKRTAKARKESKKGDKK